MTIDILCKVVDNYGDIGVVYRLAKALAERAPEAKLRLVVDDLGAFAKLEPAVDPSLEAQELGAWTVLSWRARWPGFVDEPPSIVLECFACGRPDWLEERLFDPARTDTRHIINVEHLSAEDWVDGLHLMPSLTRSALVKKWIFMPGFTPGSGGLILDGAFMEARGRWARARREGSLGNERLALAKRLGLPLADGDESALWLAAFSYERDYSAVMRSIAAYAAGGGRRPVLALAASGRSQACFMEAWERAGRPCAALALPFLPQDDWDELLLACDFSIVRGEESLSRAALAGRPFLWQAYLQDEAHHQVKVAAFLEALRPFLADGDWQAVAEAHREFNERQRDDAAHAGAEDILPLLAGLERLAAGYGAFAESLEKNGNLADKLLTFIATLV